REPKQILLPGSPEIVVAVIRNARSRRLSLRLSRMRAQATLTMPPHCTMSEAERFVREKESWLRQHFAATPERVTVGFDTKILIEGRPVPICQGTGRRTHLTSDALLVPPGDDMIGARVKAFLKLRAKSALHTATQHYADALGQNFGRITLRDTTSRWGSCSSQRNINYSWRLIMAPKEVLNYVAAHEVAHLIEMNHSPAYWAQVARVYPNYQEPRDWLREQGERLHSFEF
ncbi:MAG: M48 family metallopeptidase, partial [Planktomarina sp.]